MPRIDVSFLVLATLCLIGGVSMGIVMGILHQFEYAPVHAHLNLLGWASLALFGLSYRSYPALQRSKLALPHFVLSSTSAVLFPLGIYFSMAHQFMPLVVAAAFAWLCGVLLFLTNLIVSLVLGERKLASRPASLARVAA